MRFMPSGPFPRWLAISWAILLVLALMGASSSAKMVLHELKVEVKDGNAERNVGAVAQASSASSSLTPPRVLLTLASNGDYEEGAHIKPSQVKKVVLVEEGGSQEHVCHPPQLVKLNIVFDAIIALAYFSIPIEVAYFYHRHPTPQLFWVYALFFSFIMLCGITHAIHALSPFELPTLHATFKVLCGLVSIITAVYLVKFIPAALKLPNYAAYLEYEIQERQISETTLRNKNEESKKLRSCTEKIRQTLQMQAILHETTSSLSTHLELDSCFFVRFRPDTKSLSLVAPVSTSNSFPSDSDSLSSFEDSSTGTLLSSASSSKPLLSFEDHDKLNGEIPFSLKAHNPNALSAFHQIVRGDHIRLLDASLLEDLFGRDATSGYADREGKFEKTPRMDKGSVATLQLSKSSVCAHIALPENNETALLILVRPPDGAVWSLSEIEMVRDVANQTEIALSQARSIERDKDLLSELQAKNSELAQAQRRAESATQAKSKFIAIMSHEMRTPLYVVTALTELLMDTQLSAEQRESLTTIQTSSRLLLAIISDVLDYSKFQQDNFIMDKAPFNIRSCIEKCVDIASVKAKEVNLEVYYHLKDSIPEVIDTDESRLSQVFLNLLSNAVKFTTTGSLLVQGWLDRYLTNEEIAQLYKTQFGRADQRHFASKSSSSSENHSQLQKSFSATSADTKPVPLHDQRNPLSSSMNIPNMGPLSSSASFISSSSSPSMPNAPANASPAQMARRPVKKLSSSSLSSNASSSSTNSSSSSDFIQRPILPVTGVVANNGLHATLVREMNGSVGAASLNASPSLGSTASNYSSSSHGTSSLMMPPQGTKMAILHFVVSDTGVGIPKDQIHRLFEEFTQLDTSVSRKYDGTGLGLAICRKVVTLMGGSIWVDSTPGVGSHFHFTIIVKIPPPSLAQPLMNPTPGAKGMNCLAITPIVSLQLQLQDFCRQMGVNLTFAKTVQEGLEILQKSTTNTTSSSGHPHTSSTHAAPAYNSSHHNNPSTATLSTQGLSSNASAFHVVLLASSSLSPDHSPFESFQKFNSIAPTLLIGDTSGLGDTMAEEIEMHQILPLPLKYKNFYISIRLCTGSPPDSEVSYERLIADMLNSSKQRQQQAVFAQSQLSHDPMSAIPIISQMVPYDGSLGLLEHVGSTGSFSNASSIIHQLHRQTSSSSLLSSSSNTSSPLVVPGNVIGQVGQNILIPIQAPPQNSQGSDGKVMGNIVSGVPIPVLCYQGPWITNTTSSGNSSPHSSGIAIDMDPFSRTEPYVPPTQGTVPMNPKAPLILNSLPPLGIAKSTSGNSLSSSSSNDSSIPSPRRYDPSTLSQLTGQSSSILSSLIMHHAPSASMASSGIPSSSSPLRGVPSTTSGGSTPRTYTASPSVHSSSSHHSPNSTSMNTSHSSGFTGSDELSEGNSTGSSSSRGITRVPSEDIIVDLAESSAPAQFASSSATGSMKRVNISSAPLATSSAPYEPLPSRIDPVQSGDVDGASLQTRWDSGEQINILLVEDNTVCRKVCLKQLEKLGFEKVDCAVNGQDALDQVKLKKYDLVMMDVMMPGVDGLSATRAIRQMGKEEDEAKGNEPSGKAVTKSDKTPSLPSSHQPYIIAITASSMLEEGSREACFGAGMDEVINKPIHLQALREAIQRFMSKSTSK